MRERERGREKVEEDKYEKGADIKDGKRSKFIVRFCLYEPQCIEAKDIGVQDSMKQQVASSAGLQLKYFNN